MSVIEGAQSAADDVPSLADTTGFKQPPATARGARTRAALVAAARVVFERDGYLESRLTDITIEAKCSTGSFYTYFSSKEEILQAVIEVVEKEMLHPGMPRLRPEDHSPLAVIEASNLAYLKAYKKNAKFMLILEQLAASNPKFRALRARRAKAFEARNARAIQDLQDRGLADPALDPLVAAKCLSSMVSRSAYGVFCLGERVSMDDLVRTLTRLWANALRLE
jgi:AcrR family transcriptional regulator